jgi:hypothetical protein
MTRQSAARKERRAVKTENGSNGGTAERTDFPKHSLEEALPVPQALQRNGGQPLSSIDMATALGRSPGSGRFRVLTAASSGYGLTGGSRKTQFTMAPLGRAIVEPTSPDERARSLVSAALNPKLFRYIYEYYKGKKFPEKQFFVNTIKREFGVADAQAEKCVDVFTETMRCVGLIKETPGGDWLSEEAVAQPVTPLPDPPLGAIDASHGAGEDGGDPDTPVGPPPHEPANDPEPRSRPNRLFLGHGKNKRPLQQLTKTLDNLGIPYLVAEEEPNLMRPVSQKVRDTMEQCGAAILVFSADREFRDLEGNPVWLSSENVANELGAASAMYGDRIIIFKEEGVELASNYSGIGYIEFEKDALDAKVNELLRELVALKILTLSLSG